MGNLVNGCVILIAMVMFGQTGNRLTADGSRGVLTVQFAVGCAVTVIMVLWRYTKLKESKVCILYRSTVRAVEKPHECECCYCERQCKCCIGSWRMCSKGVWFDVGLSVVMRLASCMPVRVAGIHVCLALFSSLLCDMHSQPCESLDCEQL